MLRNCEQKNCEWKNCKQKTIVLRNCVSLIANGKPECLGVANQSDFGLRKPQSSSFVIVNFTNIISRAERLQKTRS